MRIKVSKLTSPDLARWACGLTIDGESNIRMSELYKNEHSPIRTQIYTVEMLDIPTFVSVHFRTHSLGITHFVKSNREDRASCSGDIGRMQPVNHGMILNAQSLINLSRKRLCFKSHELTKGIMEEIRHEVMVVDSALAEYMVPECVYRGRCLEKKPCGMMGR